MVRGEVGNEMVGLIGADKVASDQDWRGHPERTFKYSGYTDRMRWTTQELLAFGITEHNSACTAPRR